MDVQPKLGGVVKTRFIFSPKMVNFLILDDFEYYNTRNYLSLNTGNTIILGANFGKSVAMII